MNTGFDRTTIGGIDVRYRVIGIEDYDLDDKENQTQFDKIQAMIEDGVTTGGVAFVKDDDMYTVDWYCTGLDFTREEE